ncbi:hypothetical protein GN958_ATG02080 [Phytophthora infestans]|uniref:Uncharacterized protein n=1 Tax=Phytophthora infestans TaxID=4787 RepID=A0A8S9VBD7_PHYIN|nr:hypothetical protein GN958_ATG02080 [Phytophthora infestans]
MALWEALPVLPITSAMCRQAPQLAAHHQAVINAKLVRKTWPRCRRLVVKGLQLRRIDLDILLDNFSLHLPKSWKPKEWYPRVGNGDRTMADALKLFDQ